jgi:hypothetical protein
MSRTSLGVSTHLILNGLTWMSMAAFRANNTMVMASNAFDHTNAIAMIMQRMTAMECRIDMAES